MQPFSFCSKVANHVLGSVLCCPGCFSVYRAKAVKDVLSLYSSTADHAVDFLTKDMGKISHESNAMQAGYYFQEIGLRMRNQEFTFLFSLF